MRRWSGPPIDPRLDAATQSVIFAMRSRRLRVQRRFARMVVTLILMALLGGGGTMLFRGGSSSEPTGQGVSSVAPDSLTLDLNQQVKDLNDVTRQLQQTP
jgi:hypothetical protein